MMDDEKAKEMFEMVKDNNRMLHSMRRSAFVGGIFKAITWIVFLIVIPYFTWLYLEPYLTLITDQYQQIQGQSAEASQFIDKIKEAGNGIPGYNTILQYFGGTKPQ